MYSRFRTLTMIWMFEDSVPEFQSLEEATHLGYNELIAAIAAAPVE